MENLITIEVLPTQDRKAVIVILRNVEPIGMLQMTKILTEFSAMLTEKFAKPASPIIKV